MGGGGWAQLVPQGRQQPPLALATGQRQPPPVPVEPLESPAVAHQDAVPAGEAFRNVQTWDMHAVLYQGSDNIYGNSAYGLNFVLPRLDHSVSTLLEDLGERGLLDDTLVVMVGEFGRTPRFENTDKGGGHRPNAYTALLAGAGIRGGMVYGASDKEGAFVKEAPVTPENFGATLYHALGAPTRFPEDLSRRVSVGEPVLNLFG